MTTSITKSRSAGFTLVEIILVLGLGAILAVVAVPAIEGWLSESRLTTKAGALIEFVQSAKLRADESSEAQIVQLLGPKDKPPKESAPNVSYFPTDKDAQWSITRPGARNAKVSVSEIHIDSRGLVEPVTFRVTAGEKYVEYRFDFLTGHAQETGSSF